MIELKWVFVTLIVPGDLMADTQGRNNHYEQSKEHYLQTNTFAVVLATKVDIHL